MAHAIEAYNSFSSHRDTTTRVNTDADPNTESQVYDDPVVDCVSCQEAKPKDDTITALCNHNYCTVCINELFRLASQDESLWPVRCCQQTISLGDARHLLRLDVYEHYEKKSEEFSTVDRIYCCNMSCSALIPSRFIDGDKATCSVCDAKTCIICKSTAHDGGDCPDDPAVRSLMETAEKEGFRQCPECKRMIELDSGCFHMTWVPVIIRLKNIR